MVILSVAHQAQEQPHMLSKANWREGCSFWGSVCFSEGISNSSCPSPDVCRGNFGLLIPRFFPPPRRWSTKCDMAFSVQFPGANKEKRAATNNPLSSYTSHCHFMETGELLISPCSLPLPRGWGAASLSLDVWMTGMTSSPPPEGSGEAPWP